LGKCIKLEFLGGKADIVPAIRTNESNNYYQEPIFVHDLKRQVTIPNYPKTHYANGCSKNIATNSSYKKVVRMFKNYANNHNLKDPLKNDLSQT
jgi:hypothetical protein